MEPRLNPIYSSLSSKMIEESNILIETGADIECLDYSLFQALKNSTYSCLPPYAGKRVASIITSHLGTVSNIIDATSHIGCDSINFCHRLDAKCISLEINDRAFECLTANKEAFEVKNITTIKCDCVQYLKTHTGIVDFIYFDPPWGGPDYWREKKMMLYLSNVPIYTVVNDILKKKIARAVIIKVPSNFDFNKFGRKTNCRYFKYDVMKPKKKNSRKAYVAFHLIICDA